MKQEHPFDQAWSAGMRAFSSWDEATTRLFDQLLRSRAMLEPVARGLSGMWRVQQRRNEARDAALRAAGLATAHDLARAHHAINRLEAQLLELTLAQREQAAALREIAAKLPARRSRKGE